jgi:hypothetical protein
MQICDECWALSTIVRLSVKDFDIYVNIIINPRISNITLLYWDFHAIAMYLQSYITQK